MPPYASGDAYIFLEDSGDTWALASTPGTTYPCNFDTPDEALRVGGMRIESTMFEILAATADVVTAALGAGVQIKINAVAYTVRDTMMIDDGLLSRVMVSKN